MLDDPRIKRVLKRYRKSEDFPDVQMDVSTFGDARLLEACRSQGEDSLTSPRELDEHALAYLATKMGIEFDSGQFDYILHSYVRSEFHDTFYKDPSVTSKPAPENGPHPKIPIAKGMRWRSVRPKDGQENYEAWEFIEDEG